MLPVLKNDRFRFSFGVIKLLGGFGKGDPTAIGFEFPDVNLVGQIFIGVNFFSKKNQIITQLIEATRFNLGKVEVFFGPGF